MKMTTELKLREISSETNYWVVRAGEAGKFFQHFTQGNIISIGHLNEMPSVSTSQINDTSEFEQLLTSYKAQLVPNQKSKSSTTVKISQVKKFVSDIKVGDVVLSLSDDYIIAGTVSSEAYIDDDIIIVRDLDGSAIGDNLDFKSPKKSSMDEKTK